MYVVGVVLLGILQKTLLGNTIPMLISFCACGLHLLAVSL